MGRNSATEDLSGWGNLSPTTSTSQTASHSKRRERDAGWSSSSSRRPAHNSSWGAALDTLQTNKDGDPRRGKKKGGVVLPDDLDPEPDWADPPIVESSDSASPGPEKWSSQTTDDGELWLVEEESGMWVPKGGQKHTTSWDIDDMGDSAGWTKVPPKGGASSSTYRHTAHAKRQSAPQATPQPSRPRAAAQTSRYGVAGRAYQQTRVSLQSRSQWKSLFKGLSFIEGISRLYLHQPM